MNMQARWTLFVGVVALAGGLGCERVPEPEGTARTAAPVEVEPPELVTEDLKKGEGAEAKKGDRVKMHYTGKLKRTGKVFDSSEGKDPLAFTIGDDGVIEGWHQGVPGMRVGGKRRLTIPSRLAYGDDGSPPKIPGKATLVFDVELVEIEGKTPSDDKKAADAGAPDGKADDKKAADAGAPDEKPGDKKADDKKAEPDKKADDKKAEPDKKADDKKAEPKK